MASPPNAASSCSSPAPRWSIAQPSDHAHELAHRLGVSDIVAQILLNRGLSAEQDCSCFLSPSPKMLADPSLLPGLPDACARIAKAIRDQHRIVIYGDYDVDGITASAILYHTLKMLGADVRTYVPHRIDEGYGLNTDAVRKLCDDGAQLIITVDCGVTAIAPVAAARERGVDVVITDHHEWHEHEGVPHLPDATAIVHPRLRPPHSDASPYPNPHLCGAGVAFKVAWGTAQALMGKRVNDALRALLVEMTALAALGTIADVVPLVGENRVIASFGLSCLPKSQLPGIQAIIASANLDGEKLDAYHVGFLIAPRLNAAGRMGHAALAVEMLTTATPDRATEIATYLEQQNRLRQATEKQTLDQVLSEISRLGDDRDDCHAILLAGQGWHPGVIGIVASRVVDRLHRPAVLISLPENIEDETTAHGAGSGRSIPGFHLARALHHCSDLLLSHGGHEMAAGLKVKPARIPELRERFQTYARQTLAPELLVPELKLECEAALPQITAALVNELSRLGPFGHGNRKPLLACRNVELALAPRRVGKTGDHIQLTLRHNGTTLKGIAFNKGEWADRLRPGQKIDIAVEPTLNEWNGRVSVEVQVRDIRPVA